MLLEGLYWISTNPNLEVCALNTFKKKAVHSVLRDLWISPASSVFLKSYRVSCDLISTHLPYHQPLPAHVPTALKTAIINTT